MYHICPRNKYEIHILFVGDPYKAVDEPALFLEPADLLEVPAKVPVGCM